MRIIGLTGGIASGKSSVARLLERLGAAVIDADQLARDAVLPGTPAHAAIVAEFGENILLDDGTLDREALGTTVFRDPEARRRLEAIVHPAIRRLAEVRLQQLRDKGVEIAVYMAPLLIEAGAVERVDEVWVVYLDRTNQLERLMKRDRLSEEDAVRRIESQMPLDVKRLYGKVVIDNNGVWESTERQVMDIWAKEVSGKRV